MPADGTADLSGFRQIRSGDQCQIGFPDPVIFEFLLQKYQTVGGSGHQDQAAGIPVQAVDNARAEGILPDLPDFRK